MKNRTTGIPILLLATALVAVLGLTPTLAHAAGSTSTPQQAQFTVQNAKLMHVLAAVRMTQDNKAPARGFAGPGSMLADPTNPHVIVAASPELRQRTCRLLRSDDGGQSWHILAALPQPPDYPWCTTGDAGVPQASIAWGRNGTLYYAHAAYGVGESGRGSAHISIMLARSTDRGDSWTTTLVDNNRGKTGIAPSDLGVTGLAVDTSGPSDVVYVGFIRNYPTAPKGSPLQDGEVDIAVSTNGGSSFGSPVNLDNFTHLTQTIGEKPYPIIPMNFFGNPYITVHKGVVIAVATAMTSTSNSPPGANDNYPALPQIVYRSTDQGRTWAASALGPPTYTAGGGGTGGMTGIGWTPEGGPQGTFLAVYSLSPQASSTSGWEKVVVQRSTDGGVSWTDPVVITDDDLSQHSTGFYPQLNVAPNGRVDVVFEDNRNEVNDHFQVYYTYSTDGGTTWSHNVQVSDQPVNFDFGISYNGDIRQTPGVASANEYAFVGWADPRNATVTTQTQDAYGAMAQFAPLPATAVSVLPIIVSVVDGLAVGVLVLLVVVVVMRRRKGAGAKTGEEPAQVGTR